MITFGAKFISSANIQKLGHDKKYREINTSFVKLSHESKKDCNVLCELAGWDSYDTFSKTINDNFQNLSIQKNILGYEFFALTTQESNFENLDPNNILGLLQTSERLKDNYIEYLQTNPEYMLGAATRKFKGIGKTMMNAYMKMLGKNKTIHLDSTPNAADFYKRIGFITKEPDIEDLSLFIKI